ncbi:hypothetical protein [Streptomyces sp. NPDC020965]|uniref:hypothetical protein n=1 Tax=Streptomyces sp. NPDC020965 TaxID=3365105 RepID=UPI0037B6FD12
MYEPHDLDDLTPHAAVDAVIEDIAAHPVTPGPGGLFTATRHISLISHLVTRFAGDSLSYAEHAHEQPSGAWRPVEALTTAAVPLAQALTRYTQALVSLAALSRPTPHTSTKDAVDRIDLHRHLPAIGHCLSDARTALSSRVTAAPGVPPSPDTTPGRRR